MGPEIARVATTVTERTVVRRKVARLFNTSFEGFVAVTVLTLETPCALD